MIIKKENQHLWRCAGDLMVRWSSQSLPHDKKHSDTAMKTCAVIGNIMLANDSEDNLNRSHLLFQEHVSSPV